MYDVVKIIDTHRNSDMVLIYGLFRWRWLENKLKRSKKQELM